VDMKGPVFLAMWNPLSLLLTILSSSLLGGIAHLGRYPSYDDLLTLRLNEVLNCSIQ
jgi:hypothetical protein